jgi:hypothetical protein
MQSFLNLLVIAMVTVACVLIGYRLWWSLVVWWAGFRQNRRARDE